MRMAVIGKGGAGKSFVSGTLARILARQGRKVLVLDSDPMPGVAITIGLGAIRDEMLVDAVEQDEDGRWKLRKGIGAATAVRRYSVEGPDGVRLLQYGKAGQEGLKPMMGSLQGFTRLVHRLARDHVLSDWTIIGDLPAGPRQTAFNWAPYAERFLVVVEPTWQSVLTARRIRRLGEARGTATSELVANKVTTTSEVEFIERNLEAAVAVVIPEDSNVAEADRNGVAPIDANADSPAVVAVHQLAGYLTAAPLVPSSQTEGTR